MAHMRVFLFGTVQIQRDDGAEIGLTRMPEALLAYLMLRRHRHHARDALAGTFWPHLSQERARSALNTALWRLRRRQTRHAASGENTLHGGQWKQRERTEEASRQPCPPSTLAGG